MKPLEKALSGAARTFEQMDIFPMRVMAAAAAAALALLLSSCALLLSTYRADAASLSIAAYARLQTAYGLFEGGLRLLALGCCCAVITDILLRSQRSVF